jgi:hypothetical protein
MKMDTLSLSAMDNAQFTAQAEKYVAQSKRSMDCTKQEIITTIYLQ